MMMGGMGLLVSADRSGWPEKVILLSFTSGGGAKQSHETSSEALHVAHTVYIITHELNTCGETH